MALISEEYEQTGGSRLLPPFTRDLATITASAEEASAPASALMNKHRRKTWRGALPGEVSQYDESAGVLLASLVDGAAFVVPDQGSAADLSPFAHTHKIVLTDSAGKTAWGYLGAPGEGEELGSELLNNPSFDAGVTGWGAGDSTLASVAGGQSGNCLQITRTGSLPRAYQLVADLQQGCLYRVFCYNKQGTSGAVEMRIGLLKVGGVVFEFYLSTTAPATWSAFMAYGTVTEATGSRYVRLAQYVADAGTILFDEASLKAVTAPAAGGCWITKTPGGDNGWAFKQYGFNANDIASYDVYPALVWLDYDFGQSVDIDALALVNHNLTAEAKILLTLGSSQGADDVGFGWFPGYTPFFSLEDSLDHGCGGFLSTDESARVHYTGKLRLLYLDAVYSGLWLRVGFWDPDNPAGYVEASTIFVGECWESESQPVVNDGGILPADPSILSKAEGGEGHREARRPYRSATYHWPNTDGSETFALWFDLLRRMGEGVPFVIDLMPATTLVNIDMRLHNQLYAMIPKGGIKTLRLPFLDHGDVQLSFEEVL